MKKVRINVIIRRKAVFFTFAAIFLIIILIAIITTTSTYRYREKGTAVSARVMTMNTFISDFEKDVDRELYIGGYRALISVNAYLRQIQGFIPELKPVFSEILVNGTANGTSMAIMRQEGQGADIESWLARINEESAKMNIIIRLDIKEVDIVQSTPWNVTVLFNTTVNISDVKNLASWTFNKVYSVQFPILGFEDPLYVVATSDKMANIINVTPTIDFVNDSSKNPENLYTHLMKSYYINTTLAPSFLMRFSGNLSPSPNGIESMVNLDEYFGQYGYYLSRSVIDYIYFGNQTTLNRCINNTIMPLWFKLDTNHTDTNVYETDYLNMTTC
jgi:hypothetical protein